jgi:hypothetical protein
MTPTRSALLTALFLFAASRVFAAEDLDKCALPKGGKTTVSQADLPPLLQRLTYGLGRRDDELRTDASGPHTNLPIERLGRAFNLNRRWVLVEEGGGFARYTKMVVYALSQKGDLAMLITDHPREVSCKAIMMALQPSPKDY